MNDHPGFDRHYDAIIAGARCAGAATAMLLARMGLSVLTVDRQAYGSETLSTHALMRGAVVQLARWGLLDQVIKAGTPAIRRTTFFYGDECVPIDIKPDHGVDALYAPRRSVLDRILVDAAARAGAQIRHGVVLTDLERDADGRVIGAQIRDETGITHSIRASIVIGADGRNSAVARLADAHTYGTAMHCSAAVYGYFPSLGIEGYRWYYRPGVSVGAIPTNDGLTCIFVLLPSDRFRREMVNGATALFDRMLAEASADFAAEVGSGERVPLRGFPGITGYFRQSFGPGWALVGDAGYFKDPITAHGITDALRDAELLARAVKDGTLRARNRYQAERDALSLELFRATDAIASFDWDFDALKQQHKRLNAAMKAETAAMAGFARPDRVAA